MTWARNSLRGNSPAHRKSRYPLGRQRRGGFFLDGNPVDTSSKRKRVGSRAWRKAATALPGEIAFCEPNRVYETDSCCFVGWGIRQSLRYTSAVPLAIASSEKQR